MTWILSKREINAVSWKDSAVLKKVNDDLTKAIKYGTISLSVDLDKQKINLASVDPCLNDMCTKTGQTIVYNSVTIPPNTSPSLYASNRLVAFGLLFSAILLVLFKFN